MVQMLTMMKKMFIAVAMLLYSMFSTAQSLRSNMDLSVNPFNSSEYMMFAGHGGASLPKEYYDQPNEQQQATVLRPRG